MDVVQKKYELTDDIIEVNGHKLHRIRALRYLENDAEGDMVVYVNRGDLGGYIETEENLSHEGICWVFDDAMVYENATVKNNAEVHDNALVYGYARVTDNARVYNNAEVYECAHISGNALISYNAIIRGNAIIGATVMCNDSCIVEDDVLLAGRINISSNAHLHGNVNIRENVSLRKNAYITKREDYICTGPIGSRSSMVTAYRSGDGQIYITTGCFNDTLDAFKNKVNTVHENNKHSRDYNKFIEMVKSFFNLED